MELGSLALYIVKFLGPRILYLNVRRAINVYSAICWGNHQYVLGLNPRKPKKPLLPISTHKLNYPLCSIKSFACQFPDENVYQHDIRSVNIITLLHIVVFSCI